MTTLIPTSSSSQPPAATAAAAAGVEAYEDMFKEITRKLYGDESAHGLYPHNTQVAQVAQLAPGAPSAAPEGGERSFTTLVSDRNITTIDYETTTVNDQQQQQGQQGQRSEEHLTTAFGLAALMQNGFPPPGAILNPVNFPTKANLVTSDDRWQQNQQQQQDQPAEQSWSGKHSSTSYSHKSFKKPKVEPQDGSPTGSSTLNIPQSDKGKGSNFNASSAASVGAATGKRYACTSCPYTTDRRDLFTRHENIHKEEKPFHCYACLKQFNRADHVKKHFMRMHRDMDYEIAKTRRITAASSTSSTPTNAKPYFSSSSSNTPVSAPAPPPPTTVVSPPVTVIPVVSTLNIPTANFPTSQLSIPTSHHHANATTTIESSSTHNSTVTAVVNSHNIITLNGGVLHHHQQQQNQQNQHQPVQQQQQQIVVAPQIVTIKQEKGVLPRDVAAGNSSSGGSTVTAATLVDEKPFAKKVKGEKRFTCCYCPWSGADNWGLKRHLNTHTKPYVCMLCDYKAARSERLATHVFKVHNKKACSKCTFFAEDQDQLNAHMQDSHPNEPAKPSVKAATSPATVGTGNVLRSLGNTFVSNNLHGNPTSSGNSFGTSVVNINSGGTGGGSSATTTILYQTTTSTAHPTPSTGNILTNSNASNLIDTINQHLAASTNGIVTVVSGNGPGGGVGQVTTPQNHHQQQHHQLHQQHNQNQNQHQNQNQNPQQQNQQVQQQQHWIAAKVHRKRGADLLYSYLEADGSDSEDYARLLTMQALGRNKASVTQDFHNAGGATTHHRLYHHSNSLNDSSDSNASNGSKDDVSHSPSSSAAPSRSPSTSPPAVAAAITPMAGATLSEEHLSLLQLLATAAVAQQHLQLQQQQQQKLAPSSSPSILSSPPANLNLNSTNQQQQQVQQVQDAKRRRKSSSRNDKENLGQKQQRTVAVGGKVIDLTVTAPGQAPAGDGIERNNNSSSNNNSSVNNKNINEAIFDRVMYKKPSSYQNMFLTSAAFCKPVLGAVEKDQQQVLRKEDRVIVAEKSFSLAEFLRNHTEVSITTTAKATSADNDDDVVFIKEEKRRKQQAPRKVDQRTVGDIRDKHMIRLITRRLCCRICQNQQRNGSLDNCHYHSKTSLILHNRWRHLSQAAAVGCRKCGQSFPRKYKLALHQKLVHRANGGKPKKVTAAKKQQRKQRKRKPKSRCFTKRRK